MNWIGSCEVNLFFWFGLCYCLVFLGNKVFLGLINFIFDIFDDGDFILRDFVCDVVIFDFLFF